MALLLIIAQTLVLVPCLALAGQALVGAFGWSSRHGNPVFQMFGIVARPALGAVRALGRRLPAPLVAPLTFALLLAAYLALGFAHRDVCRADLQQPACERWAAPRSTP